jgi:hypothetical protein
LDDKFKGPFLVKSCSEGNITLELPRGWKIHPTFALDLVRPWKDASPVQKAINEDEAEHRPIIVEDDDGTTHQEWGVEGIEDSRKNDRRLEYLVRWAGGHKPTWNYASDMKNAKEAIQEFHRENPDRDGPPSWARPQRV